MTYTLLSADLIWRIIASLGFGLAIGLISSMVSVPGGELIIPRAGSNSFWAQFSIFRPGGSFTTKPGSRLQFPVQYLQHPAPAHQSHQPAFCVHHRQSLNVMDQEQVQGFQ